MMRKAILVVTILVASQISHAQGADTTKAVELKSVTITATRSEKFNESWKKHYRSFLLTNQ
ncbi:MAG: hypothetical protein IPL55_12680 [Saprospiraceae bacterium]|nr:hypothetical protein [Saprospiraceae bacterium]